MSITAPKLPYSGDVSRVYLLEHGLLLSNQEPRTGTVNLVLGEPPANYRWGTQGRGRKCRDPIKLIPCLLFLAPRRDPPDCPLPNCLH